jgi:hypothetical protein
MIRKLLIIIGITLCHLLSAQSERDSLLLEIQKEEWIINKDVGKILSWSDNRGDFLATAHFDRDQHLKYVVWRFYDRNYYLIIYYHIFTCTGMIIQSRDTFICQGNSYEVKLRKKYLYVKKVEHVREVTRTRKRWNSTRNSQRSQ